MKGFVRFAVIVVALSSAAYALAPWEPIHGVGEAMGKHTLRRPSRNLWNKGIKIPYYTMNIDFKESTQGFSFVYNSKGNTVAEIDLVSGTVQFKRHKDAKEPGTLVKCSENPLACLNELDEVQFYITDFRRHLDLFPAGKRLTQITAMLDNADKKIKAMRDQIKRLYGVEQRVNEHRERFDGAEGRQYQEQYQEELRQLQQPGAPEKGTHYE